jgi:hypothetical protein
MRASLVLGGMCVQLLPEGMCAFDICSLTDLSVNHCREGATFHCHLPHNRSDSMEGWYWRPQVNYRLGIAIRICYLASTKVCKIASQEANIEKN